MQTQAIKAFDGSGAFHGFVEVHGEVAIFATKAAASTVVDNITAAARTDFTYKVVPAPQAK